MSVLIKGMWMPKHCWQCRFKDSEDLCVLLDDDCMKIWGEQNRLPDCPLIKIPDHGDLIDRDALKDKAEFIGDAFSGRGGFAVWGTDVINAPVVIPAERSEE